MRVAHFIPYRGRAQGGPVVGLCTLAAAQAGLGCEVEIWSAPRTADGEPHPLDPRVERIDACDVGWGTMRHAPSLWARIETARADVVHSHGLWTDHHRLAAAAARRWGVPHVLAPCGMLAPDARARSAWKKAIVGRWFQYRALREAAVLHAKSELEAGHLRAWAPDCPVVMLPNPVAAAPEVDEDDRAAFARLRGDARPGRMVLYLGRLHPVKGVLRLVDAWASCWRPEDGRLLLAGPDEDGFRATVERRIRERGVDSSVRCLGPLDARQRAVAFEQAAFLAVPSDFENFGLAAAEALAAGCPVMASDGTPWSKLPSEGAGWWVERSVEAWACALDEALHRSPDRLATMREPARRVGATFAPEAIARQWIARYRAAAPTMRLSSPAQNGRLPPCMHDHSDGG